MPKRRRVLFVDDDQSFLDGLARHLRKATFQCDYENSGEGALMRLQSGDFDVVVIDNNMPGMGGVRFAGEVAKTWPGIVIIMLSGLYSVEGLIDAVNIGHVYRVMSKPCDVKDLQIAIIVALRHKVELESLYRSTSGDDYLPHDEGVKPV